MDFVFPVTTIPALPWSAVSSIPGCQLRPSSGMCRQGLLIALGPSAAVIRVFFSSSSISDHTDLRPFSQSDRHSLHVFLLIHNSTYEVKTPIPILQSISPTNWRKLTREGGHVTAFPPQPTSKLVCNPTNHRLPCCLSHPKVRLFDFCFNTDYGNGSANFPDPSTTDTAFSAVYQSNFTFLSIQPFNFSYQYLQLLAYSSYQNLISVISFTSFNMISIPI